MSWLTSGESSLPFEAEEIEGGVRFTLRSDGNPPTLRLLSSFFFHVQNAFDAGRKANGMDAVDIRLDLQKIERVEDGKHDFWIDVRASREAAPTDTRAPKS